MYFKMWADGLSSFKTCGKQLPVGVGRGVGTLDDPPTADGIPAHLMGVSM